MKTIHKVKTLLVFMICGMITMSYSQIRKNKTDKPNVIVVLADDIGVGDISFYRNLSKGKVILETPHIDNLAEQGMIFTNAHAPAALCATSRYGIMTGNCNYRSPVPWGVWSGYAKSVFTPEQITLGKLMKNANYNTAFFGKWHMGTSFKKLDDPNAIFVEKGKLSLNVDITKIVAGGPQQNGFDYSFSLPSGIQNVPYAVYENSKWFPLGKDSEVTHITKAEMLKKGVVLNKKEGLGDSNWHPSLIGPLLINKTTNHIAELSKKEKPFFIYYCSQAVHLPHNPPKELNGIQIAGTTPSSHMDMIKELDVQIGMMIQELKKQGVYENTVFIFTSDNGGLYGNKKTRQSGHKPSDIYRGKKNDPYEGGQRVPFIAVWPGKIESNQISSKPILGLDILATLAGITEQEIPKGQAEDSSNLLSVLKGDTNANPHPYLMIQGGAEREAMIIENEWKLIIQFDKKDKTDTVRTPVALFNLKDNISENEEFNFINDAKYKDKVASLLKKYNQTRDNKTPIGNHN
ncbi:arylsulfatase [Flavivirga abyssicola]|uniref:sulfatase family protein n=1 Tax=Flavivirga abyssicola TaxID=3063533 RepID=UPI0026E03EB6|nr:arylsulfatase [Flavivirga sp. MEBiC07777]WVK13790.1 arylsulfatase [Flavivirga sp. MEBiC07777]